MRNQALADTAEKPKVDIYFPEQGVSDLIKAVLGEDYDVSAPEINRDTTPEDVAEMIDRGNPDLVYLALNFGRTQHAAYTGSDSTPAGMNVLKYLRENGNNVPVALVSSGTLTDKVAEDKYGVAAHLTMPLNLDKVKEVAMQNLPTE